MTEDRIVEIIREQVEEDNAPPNWWASDGDDCFAADGWIDARAIARRIVEELWAEKLEREENVIHEQPRKP